MNHSGSSTKKHESLQNDEADFLIELVYSNVQLICSSTLGTDFVGDGRTLAAVVFLFSRLAFLEGVGALARSVLCGWQHGLQSKL